MHQRDPQLIEQLQALFAAGVGWISSCANRGNCIARALSRCAPTAYGSALPAPPRRSGCTAGRCCRTAPPLLQDYRRSGVAIVEHGEPGRDERFRQRRPSRRRVRDEQQREYVGQFGAVGANGSYCTCATLGSPASPGCAAMLVLANSERASLSCRCWCRRYHRW